MTRAAWIAGALAMATTAAHIVAQSAPAQHSTFAAGTDVVTVDVSVTDRNRPVAGLTAADFLVTDNGVRQRVEAVSADGLPVNVTLLLDTSASVEPVMNGLLDQVREAGRQLRAPDRLRLLTFAGSVSEIFPMGPPPASMSLAGVAASGGTALYDALAAALVRRRPPDRAELVIAVTDGVDTASAMAMPRLRDLAERSEAVLFVFLLRSSATVIRCAPHGLAPAPIPATCGADGLNGLAESTGGTVFTLGPGLEVIRAMQTALATFRTSYTLRYAAQGVTPSGWHELRVRLAGPGAYTIRARTGYHGG